MQNSKKRTVIPRYTSNRFTSFRLYKKHKLITVFNLRADFRSYELLPLANRSVFPSGSNEKLILILRVFALRAVLEEQIKLVNRGITAFGKYVGPVEVELPALVQLMVKQSTFFLSLSSL
jgi:hypothetical protein